MVNILISIFMVGLLAICLLMAVIILMQKPSANAGMGAALGGGAAESVFGGEAGNMLLKYTIRIAVAFFALSFLLYMGILANHRIATTAATISLPVMAPESAAAGAPAPSAKTTPPGAATSSGSILNVALPGDTKTSPAPAASTPAASTN
jgi:preprotein translocase subunit SecG